MQVPLFTQYTLYPPSPFPVVLVLFIIPKQDCCSALLITDKALALWA